MSTNTGQMALRNRFGPFGRLVLLAALTQQTARAEVFGAFLTKIVGLIAGGWGISIAIIGTGILGARYLFADRHDHGMLVGWIIGSILILGCSVVYTQFFV